MVAPKFCLSFVSLLPEAIENAPVTVAMEPLL